MKNTYLEIKISQLTQLSNTQRLIGLRHFRYNRSYWYCLVLYDTFLNWVCLICSSFALISFVRFDMNQIKYNSQPLACQQTQKCGWLELITISKFSAPTITFLAFWLAKKLRLWANSRSFFCVIWKIVRQVFSFRTLCKIVEIKIGGKTWFKNLLKQLFHSPLLDMKWL